MAVAIIEAIPQVRHIRRVMTVRSIKLALALLATILLWPHSAILAEGNQSDRPNVILILADDLGYGDLGCYGSETNDTPHIDKLAEGGLRFTDFHSAGAMCSPTRASILTGCYPQRFGSMFDGALSGTTQRDVGLPTEAMTIAEVLRGNGYATGCFGKWHLGYQAPFLPTNQGFMLFRGLVSGDGDFHTHIDRSGNEDWWYNERIERDVGYTTDLLTEYSVDFIETHRERPFFLYLSHLAIHFPWQGPDDPPHRTVGRSWHQDKWGVIPDRNNVSPHVRAMIASLDASVGAIVEALKDRTLAENTIVIFTSDNGGYLTYGKNFKNISSNGRYRGQKTQLYEGGHRVPMIVSWPRQIPPGVTEAVAHSNDLFPTILNLTHSTSVDTDGIDLTPVLFEREPIAERDLFWRSSSHAAVRSGPWKLVVPRKDSSKPELFHLADDPGERRNVANMHPGIVKQLRSAWSKWETEVDLSSKEYNQ